MSKELKTTLQGYSEAGTKERKEDVLSNLYGIRESYEINEKKGKDRIFSVKFNIPALEKAQLHIYKLLFHIERKDLEQYVLISVHEIFEEGKFNLILSNREIEIWFTKTLIGKVKNLAKKEHDKNGLNVWNVIKNENGKEVGTRYDEVALDRYVNPYVQTSFDNFIDSIGGYQSILSEKQFEALTLAEVGHTQQEIADMTNTTQQNVQKMLKLCSNSISKQYMDYRLMYIASKSQDTNKLIENHLQTIKEIREVDIEGTYNYYAHIYNFLYKQYKSYNINNDKSNTVFDIIYDNLGKTEHELIKDVVNSFHDKTIVIAPRQQNRLIKITYRIFTSYLASIYVAVGNISNTLIDNHKSTKHNINDYDYFINNIS